MPNRLTVRYHVLLSLLAFALCNMIPTCSGPTKAEISRSFAMPTEILPLANTLAITNYFPQWVSRGKDTLVSVSGAGFCKDSRLYVKGFQVDPKYFRVIDNGMLLVKVPGGVPRGTYPVVVKNPDGTASNKVLFEVRG